MRRGEIWWAALPSPTGSGPGFPRPVLVVQSDEFNASQIQTITAVVLTSNLKLSEAPGNVLLSQGVSGLPRDSVANVSQVVTVDKSLLTERLGRVPSAAMEQVDEGLRLSLGL